MTHARTAVAADFDGFYQANFRDTVAIIYGLTGDLGEAQDIAQEAFSRAWQRWHMVSNYDNPVYWVRRVATNLSHSRWRRIKVATAYLVRQRLEDVPELSPVSVDIVNALKQLPPSQRKAIVLHYLVDMPVEEVAAELDVPANTVKSWLLRGRAALSAQLADDVHRSVILPGARQVRDRGEKRQRANRISAGAAAVIILFVTGLVFLKTAHTSEPAPPATPSPWISPIPAPVPRPAEPKFPATCTPEPLPMPAGYENNGSGYLAADPSGRYIAGLTGREDEEDQKLTLWEDGTVKVSVPLPRLVLPQIAINKQGVAIIRLQSEPESGNTLVLDGGKLSNLKGVNPVGYDISGFGLIVGQADFRPAFWRSADAEPEFLQLPPGKVHGVALAINDAGVIIGSVRRTPQLVVGRTEGSFVAWYPDGRIEELQLPGPEGSATEAWIRGDSVFLRYANSLFRWDAQTEALEALGSELQWGFNTYGWSVVRKSAPERDELNELRSSAGSLQPDIELPGYNGPLLAHIGFISDAGDRLAGTIYSVSSGGAVARAVRWLCQ